MRLRRAAGVKGTLRAWVCPVPCAKSSGPPPKCTGQGDTIAVQWQNSTDGGTTWNAIKNATATTYLVGVGDTGTSLRAQQTVTNADGPLSASTSATATATATITAQPPVSTTIPVITGSTQRGSTLTATQGTWQGLGNSYAYQWQRCDASGNACQPITDAINHYYYYTYTLSAGDETDSIVVQVTATNPDGAVTAQSSATAVVPPAPPVNRFAPTLTGTAQRIMTLVASAGTWAGIANVTSYQWQRSTDKQSWNAITAANGLTYTLAQADESNYVRLEITVTNTDGGAIADTPASALVQGLSPANTTSPAVAGTGARGSVLTASVGAWTGLGNAYTYQWMRSLDGTNWIAIFGATNSTYTLAKLDEGDDIKVVVTATNTDGTADATGNAINGVTPAAPAASTLPSVSGIAQRAGALTATTGVWSGAGNTYSEQWQESSDGGTTWTPIASQTSTRYTVLKADEGSIIRMEVTATNVDATIMADSPATSPVAAVPPVMSRPRF